MSPQDQEAFKPIPVRRGTGFLATMAYSTRQWIDLQLLTCTRFLRPRLAQMSGAVLDVGCGEMPFRDYLPKETRYVGLDVAEAVSFGMRDHPDIVMFDGVKIPFPDNSWDGILCTEVLEHTLQPDALMAEMLRVLRPGGTLLVTVPFAARVHHAPHDYQRFTRYRLARMMAGFQSVQVLERGNDFAVIANKLIVLIARLLTGRNKVNLIWTLPVILAFLGPMAVLALIVAHVSMWLGLGSRDDPLGYGCVARKA